MKKKIMIACVSILTFIACKKDVGTTSSNTGVQIVSEAAVPAAVLTSFNASFSSSTEREWRHEDDSYYCQFNMDDQRHEAEFDDNGHEDNHSVICLDAPVPEVVLNAFRAAYPNDVVYEWKLTNENTWKAHSMVNGTKQEVTISQSGEILKVENE